jgi:hypothetical protein
MNIVASGRLLDQIHAGEPRAIEDRGEPKFMEEWYVDMYTMGNRKFFIFTEAKTFFSVFAYGKGVVSIAAFSPFFYDGIRNAMLTAVPMLRLANSMNPAMKFFVNGANTVRKTQKAHIRMAKINAALHVSASECNKDPISATDGRIPLLLFMADIVKAFKGPGPFMHISQIN